MAAAPLAWTTIEVSPAAPAARTYASLISYGPSLYLFGGYGESKGRFNDVFEYNTISRTWRLVPFNGEAPKPVYLHSAVQHNNNMIVFGGNNGKESNDLFSYDLLTATWSRAPAAGGSMFQPALFPAPRYGHASCVYGNGQLLIVGGCRSNNTYFKDAYSMDLQSRKWRKLEDLPLDLAYHSLLTWQDRAYLFGGYNGKSYVQHIYVLDSMTGKWNVVAASGQVPPPMCGAATIIKGNDLFVFGGYTEGGHTNELYRFNMQTRVWTLMNTVNKPLARAYLQAAVVGDVCSIFGGYDGHSCISDFRCINLPMPAGSTIPQSLPQGGSMAAPPLSSSSSGHNPFASSDLFQLPLSSQVDTLLQTYSYNNESINRQQLQNLLTQLGQVMRDQSFRQYNGGGSANNNAAASGAANGSSSYPFNTSCLSSVTDLGFPRDRVLVVMARMHSAGQSTTNTNLVVDMCIKDAAEEDKKPPAQSPGFDRQASTEKAQLKQKVADLQELQENERTCKVCCDETINSALLQCGHLVVCTTCADALISKGKPCPICQKKINGKLKIYWS